MTPAIRTHRAVLGAYLALALAAAVVLTGGPAFAKERVPGRASVILDEVVGPETGPVCALDERYVNEEPRGLRPDVLAAWHRLRTEAGKHGVRLCLNDGKRSAGQQRREFTDAVQRFGTEELAARYVLPPEKSMHVKGIAVDVQPHASAGWVERNGHALGWCRRYENEYWHFEYSPDHRTSGCPAMLPSATGL
ncbi:peptidase M15 [Prauserella sp. PE36]|uniref:Peptidase M15 n=1 Tax=Prauserella endophytica TaxID=1592324 RepID=A0ABY2RW04_9PSEU|nr:MULTISPECIES: D-alanyl-D-alanine carboxypeptidase family protein [Prauserella]RBM13052.1 peptidase M15 [Prauserella sp. PE36]TKG62839.1 peptidase M15 [Prauserella endophytica]